MHGLSFSVAVIVGIFVGCHCVPLVTDVVAQMNSFYTRNIAVLAKLDKLGSVVELSQGNDYFQTIFLYNGSKHTLNDNVKMQCIEKHIDELYETILEVLEDAQVCIDTLQSEVLQVVNETDILRSIALLKIDEAGAIFKQCANGTSPITSAGLRCFFEKADSVIEELKEYLIMYADALIQMFHTLETSRDKGMKCLFAVEEEVLEQMLKNLDCN